jgi:hypothetical protein
MENNRIKLVMPYNELLVEKIKRIEGKAWIQNKNSGASHIIRKQ